MAEDEKRLTIVRAAPERKVDTRPRVNGVLVHRMERLRTAMEAQLMRDMGVQTLSRYCFMDDAELDAVRVGPYQRPLTKQQKAIVRRFEMSKKEAPVSLQFGHDRLINAQRAQQETKSLSINVERAVIRVPDTRTDAIEDAIIIDAEAGIAPR